MSKSFDYEKFLDRNLFYTHEEVANEYGHSIKKNIASSLVLKSEELFLEYKNNDLIEVDELEHKSVSKKLIHDLLSDEGMYRYLQNNLSNDLGIAARIDYIIDLKSVASIKLTRRDFIEALNQMSGDLSQHELMRSAVIRSSWVLFSCEQRYRNTLHRTFINDSCLDIPASVLIRILSCREDEFNKFINGDINFGYAKEILAYALVDFVERERILIKYVFPKNIIDRYENIKNYSLIDFESINKNRIKNDLNEYGESIIDKIELSSELKSYLNAEIDETYSNLEKAIYYYIKLCEVFSLDDNYYLSTSQSLLEEHTSTDNINSKTPSNNKVAMYDFLSIYASILNELKIDFTLNQTLMNGGEVGSNLLTFKYGEYLVSISSLANPSESDLTNVKINDRLTNITSINKNKVTKAKFKELTERIYKDILSKRTDKKTFQESLSAYKQTLSYSKMPITDKIYILLKEITRTDLKGLELSGYTKKLFSSLFKGNKNIAINILAKRVDNSTYLTPVIIVSYLGLEYHYLVVDKSIENSLRSVSLDELTSLLSENKYYYIDSKNVPSSTEIPGISRYVGDKIVR